jgi:c-di-GMP-binding flagellar brake protein YcgR
MAEREVSVEEEEYNGPERRRPVALEGMVERRQHTRYAVDVWAEVTLKDGTMLFRGRALDVSLGGCYIETEAKLKLAPGTRVEMVFQLNEDVFRYETADTRTLLRAKQRFRLNEDVLRCEATIRMVRTRGAGFLFSHLDAGMRRELERLIQELEGAEE